MQQLEQDIKAALSAAIQQVFGATVTTEQLVIQPTRKEFAGTFTLVTFSLTKSLGKGPEQIGQALGEWLAANEPRVSGFNVVKGFLNLEIGDSEWLRQFAEMLARPDNAPVPSNGPQRVVVEYSSPNTNKPLHLGHLRNIFLGYSVAEIVKATGATVTKANLINDRGIHICKSMLAYQRFGHGETPQSSGIKGDHLIGKYYVLFERHYKEEIRQLEAEGVLPDVAKRQAPLMTEAQYMLQQWEQGDEEVLALWKQMNGWVYEGFDETYRTIGVDFDKYYYESETYLLGKERVEEGLQKGVFFRKDDGSVWVDLKEEGLDEKLLLRADGTSVYITQDLGTAELKYQDFNYDSSVYVIADEQNYHMQVLQAVLHKLGKPYAEAIHHLSYGMVDLPSGRMKSREGTVVDADELVQEMIDTARRTTQELGKIEGLSTEEAEQLYHTLALGALKYFLLKVDPKKRMLFNPEESINFQGNTGPFVQYTHARIAAIMRKATELGLTGGQIDAPESLHETERDAVQLLAGYPGVVAEAARLMAPSILVQYVYEVAKAYNRFYTEVPVFGEPDETKRRFRVALSAQTGRTIKAGMRLLGITVPERM
ncbi:arginine--tRNA ligase [Hymenobacter qilianensis]|uniref:Arginine--tRNA ligase n=2 Tax=Hymenobacter qilianensis TaxID=1385715 RepID=A0ACB5PWQ9_9BACT|nr:arginine--tRNA ligase [Hymenobacter qilianensis]QNP51034.1 arginine--tRNA ligase [Hymenobacter qilianensis]GGF78980.1 arginine--tRNA ligase [Hymenobacter qilianensis]